jgi:hypothetical protein
MLVAQRQRCDHGLFSSHLGGSIHGFQTQGSYIAGSYIAPLQGTVQGLVDGMARGGLAAQPQAEGL